MARQISSRELLFAQGQEKTRLDTKSGLGKKTKEECHVLVISTSVSGPETVASRKEMHFSGSKMIISGFEMLLLNPEPVFSWIPRKSRLGIQRRCFGICFGTQNRFLGPEKSASEHAKIKKEDRNAWQAMI